MLCWRDEEQAAEIAEQRARGGDRQVRRGDRDEEEILNRGRGWERCVVMLSLHRRILTSPGTSPPTVHQPRYS